jgi:energy-converting hydrogenase Eha subunit E
MRKLVLILIGFIAVATFIRTFDKRSVISAEDMVEPPAVTSNE